MDDVQWSHVKHHEEVDPMRGAVMGVLSLGVLLGCGAAEESDEVHELEAKGKAQAAESGEPDWFTLDVQIGGVQHELVSTWGEMHAGRGHVWMPDLRSGLVWLSLEAQDSTSKAPIYFGATLAEPLQTPGESRLKLKSLLFTYGAFRAGVQRTCLVPHPAGASDGAQGRCEAELMLGIDRMDERLAGSLELTWTQTQGACEAPLPINCNTWPQVDGRILAAFDVALPALPAELRRD